MLLLSLKMFVMLKTQSMAETGISLMDVDCGWNLRMVEGGIPLLLIVIVVVGAVVVVFLDELTIVCWLLDYLLLLLGKT